MADDERAAREERLREALYSRYHVRNDAELPLAFLKMMPEEPLENQLAARKIRSVSMISIEQRDEMEARLPPDERVAWVACLETALNIGGFRVWLLQGRSIPQMAHSVGHEAGHTFTADLENPRLERFTNAHTRPPIGFEETACDYFGTFWTDWLTRIDRKVLQIHLEMLKVRPEKPWIIEP
jgi:hypothetical protein